MFSRTLWGSYFATLRSVSKKDLILSSPSLFGIRRSRSLVGQLMQLLILVKHARFLAGRAIAPLTREPGLDYQYKPQVVSVLMFGT